MFHWMRRIRRRYPHFWAATRYAEQVVAKKIDACLFVRQACERQLNDLERNFGYVFDPDKAEAVCRSISKLPHVKGEWAARRELIRLEPWQAFGLTTVFGWVHPEDVHDRDGVLLARAGQRRFRTAYEEVPRKNAKTTIAAGVGLYMTREDGEAGAEVYSNATTRNQARIVFDLARAMAQRSTAGWDVRAHVIADLETASKFAPLHAQGETLDGYNIHCAINDEVHAWKRRSVYEVIETATGARRQPLMFNITTAGNNLDGICYDLRAYTIRLLSGTITDESFFGIIYTIDQDEIEHWQDRRVWKKANPNWGVSVYPMDIESLARKAVEVISEQNAFLTKRLNVWVNAAVAWMNMVHWHRGFDPRLKIEDFTGEPCWAGIDLASKIDVNSLAVVFKREIAGVVHHYVFMKHWLPEAAIAEDRFGQYDGWVRSGHITKTPGNVIDVDVIEEHTKEIATAHQVQELGVDPGHNSTQYAVHMAEAGLTVVDVRPTVMNFSEPMKWLEGWAKDGTVHFNCPVLSWMVSNVVAKRDAKDNLYPRKDSPARKIDGVIALLIAINRMMAQDGGQHVEGQVVVL